MSIPAAPPFGLDSLGELHDVRVTPAHAGSHALVGGALLGLSAGLRTMTPLAALALTRPWTGPALPIAGVLLSLGELVVDKIPSVPARTRFFPALARAASGAMAGAIAARRARRPPALGGIVGALAAMTTTQVGLRLRRRAEEILPAPVAALAEDALAVTIAIAGVARRVPRC